VRDTVTKRRRGNGTEEEAQELGAR